jgi:hypothetical protein
MVAVPRAVTKTPSGIIETKKITVIKVIRAGTAKKAAVVLIGLA